MDFTLTIQSLNKIALIAFVVVLALIIFETWMMLKNDKKKKVVTDLPDFKDGIGQKTTVVSPPVKENKLPKIEKKVTGKRLYVVVLVMSLIGLATFGGYYVYTNSSQTPQEAVSTEQQVKVVESSGIIIFDSTWKRMYAENIEKALGDKIYIGIETVAGSDIDMARIKINKEVWSVEDETKAINSEYGVFYKEYIIATDEPKLKIDAQLHSISNGWLQE